MPLTPTAAGQGTASLAASNLASLATALTGMQASIIAGNLGPAAFMDAILSSVGYQAKVLDTAGPSSSNTTTSAPYVNMPAGASGTFTAPIAKSYEIGVEIGSFWVATAQPTQIAFRLVVNSVSVTPLTSMQFWFNAIGDRRFFAFRQYIPMNAGANTIQVQWGIVTGTGVATWDNNSWMAIHARG